MSYKFFDPIFDNLQLSKEESQILHSFACGQNNNILATIFLYLKDMCTPFYPSSTLCNTNNLRGHFSANELFYCHCILLHLRHFQRSFSWIVYWYESIRRYNNKSCRWKMHRNTQKSLEKYLISSILKMKQLHKFIDILSKQNIVHWYIK